VGGKFCEVEKKTGGLFPRKTRQKKKRKNMVFNNFLL
jgi:hypothetical protein